jgi:hypothetical protein
MAETKKISVKFNVDSKEVIVAGEGADNLKKKVRALQQELLKTEQGTEQFYALSNALDDTQDELDKASAKGRDLLGSLQLIPGPIGEISSKVNGAISAFKLFGDFKLDDIKAQFKKTADDVKDVGNLIAKNTGITKIYTTINNALSKSFKAVGASEAVASAGAKGFSAALTATGIGAIVVALGLLVANFDKVSKAVLNLIPGLKKVGDFFGGLINQVTDFIGLTSEAERKAAKAQEVSTKQNEAFQKQIEKNNLFLKTYGKNYDEFTQNKIKAKNDYLQTLIDINNSEIKDEKQKNGFIKAAAEAYNKELNKIDEARKNSGKKTKEENKKNGDEENKELQIKLRERKAIIDAAIQDEIDKANTDGIELAYLYEQQLKDRIEAEKLTAKEIEIIRKENTAKVNKALEDDYKNQQDLYKKNQELQLGEINKFFETQSNLRISNLDRENQKEKDALLERLYDRKITEEEYNRELLLLDQTQAQKKIDLLNNNFQIERAAYTLAYQNGLIDEQTYFDSLEAITKDYNDKSIQATTELNNAQKNLRAQDYQNAKATEEAKKEIRNQALENVLTIGSTLQQIAGKNKKLAKAGLLIEKGVNIATIVANTAAANAKITKTYGLPAGIPFIAINTAAGALGVIKTIQATQKGIQDIDAANEGGGGTDTIKKLASGGLVRGEGSGTSDSIPAMLSNGESVINANSTKLFQPLLSTINELGGGARFDTSSSNNTLMELLNQQNKPTEPPVIKTYVVGSDITSRQQMDRVIKSRSTI